jgi:hypothetical protein
MNKKIIRKIIKEKVIGKWVPCHDESGHKYRHVESEIVESSVTTKNVIDKPRLIPWAIGLAIDYLEDQDRFELLKTDKREDIIKSAKLQYTDYRDDAGNVGSIAHDVIEDYVNKWITSTRRPADIRKFFKGHPDLRSVAVARAAEKVFDKYKCIPLATEIIVGIPTVGAGTLDMLVLNESNEIELWDWKSSNNINDYYACQTSAYAKFFEHMTGLPVAKCRIFKLDKMSDRFKSYIVDNIDLSYFIYRSCSNIYEWLNNGVDKLVKDENKIIIT